jgi:hypothetical protein
LNHQLEAQHPKSSAIHKPPADYPIYGSKLLPRGPAAVFALAPKAAAAVTGWRVS